jgi:serine palmitoyltransferase
MCVSAGKQKLASIRRNSNFFRNGLKAMGVEVLGDDDSPIIPMMLFNVSKLTVFSRECLERGVRACLLRAY